MKQEEKLLHFSVGSAATSTHVSIDLPLYSDTLSEDITQLLKVWETTRLAREKYDLRRKSK